MEPPPAAATTSTSTSVSPSSAVEQAVITKGRAGATGARLGAGALVLLHPPALAATTPAVAFSRHAKLLQRHLLRGLRASPRYTGVALLGLEDAPSALLGVGNSEASPGGVIRLDGFSMGATKSDGEHPVQFTSVNAFVASVREALPTSAAPATAAEHEEEEAAAASDEDEEEDDAAASAKNRWALGIDSLDMLTHRLGGAPQAMRAIKSLLQPAAAIAAAGQEEEEEEQQQHPSCSQPPSPIVAVLHPPHPASRRLRRCQAAWEDVATTNIYVYPTVDDGAEARGRCLVVRRSASGRVQEEWEEYRVVPLAGGGQGVVLGASVSVSSSSAADAEGGEGKDKDALLQSLSSFRLTAASEQERAMREATVLPHERAWRTGNGDGGNGAAVALGYQQEGQVPVVVEEDPYDEDEGIDDDLDI